MKSLETKTGFRIEADEKCLDDMELFEAVVDLQNGNVFAIKTIAEKMCGKNKKALYDHCRDASGRVPVQAVTAEINDMFEGLNAKNS